MKTNARERCKSNTCTKMSQEALSSIKKKEATWEHIQHDLDQFVKVVSIFYPFREILSICGIEFVQNNHITFAMIVEMAINLGTAITFKTKKIQIITNQWSIFR